MMDNDGKCTNDQGSKINAINLALITAPLDFFMLSSDRPIFGVALFYNNLDSH